MNRVRRLKLALWALIGLAASVATARFIFGLGASTNLTDANPWGIWVGFDVMGGVALAAGGFIVTATVYIFKLEKFHSVVRPAVLTAFLGYLAVAVGLLFDLGLPWNIWHMMVYWNPRSPLFEVGWCVMLYLTVLALEFFPVPAEEFPRLASIRAKVVKVTSAISHRWHRTLDSAPVIVGFAVSDHAVPAASAVVLADPSSHVFDLRDWARTLDGNVRESSDGIPLPPKAGDRPAGFIRQCLPMGVNIYLSVRVIDLVVRQQASRLFVADWRTGLFWFEITVMGSIPIALFSLSRVRHSRAGQWTAATFAVCGIVLNRIDVGGVAHPRPDGAFYLPSWTEIAISVGVVSAAMLVFLFVIEHFKVWEERPADPNADPLKLPELDPVGATWLGVPGHCGPYNVLAGFHTGRRPWFWFLEGSAGRRPRGRSQPRFNAHGAVKSCGSMATSTVSALHSSTRSTRSAKAAKSRA